MEGLVAQGLQKWFKTRKVVDNVSLDIQRGEVVGLLGPNGAGKTTSFYMMVGLLPTEGGRIFLEGQEITSLPMYQRCRMGVGYLPQESSVFRKLTVEENLLAILETLDLSVLERRARARELLAELDLTALAPYPAFTLSGGERRRLEITRALVTSPQYLLLDEPFTGIDPIAIGDIQEVVQKELLENPLLEEVQPETAEQPDGQAAPDVPTAPPAEPLSSEAAPPPTTERQTDDLPFDLTAVIFDDHEERSLVAQEDREDLPFENMVRSVSSLTDHLDEQLRYASDDPLVRRIGTEIIGNLDEDGYLRASDEEIAQRCQTAVEEVRKVVALVQAFDPPGVAARSIQECLLIQLKADPNPDPVSVEIVEEHFEDLSRRRYPDIARALKLPLDRIMESVEEIMGLEPKPGRRFGGNDSRYIVPDVVVHKMGSEYVVVLNEDGIPRLRVNSLYRSLLRNSADGEARQYVDQKLRSALWLIKSVDQRQRTLRKVTQSIVKFQREFLDKGLPYLRPLSLRDVGEDIGMHESTISRVTTNKYVETPQGLFELKFFFHSGIASGDGEMVSSVSVKKMIQDILAAEDPAKPQSDQEVAQALQKRGLTIARRTVAKYREELGILPSHQRRLAPRKR